MALTRLEAAILEVVKVGLRAERLTLATAFRASIVRLALAADINSRSIALSGNELVEQIDKMIGRMAIEVADDQAMRESALVGAQPHTLRRRRGPILLRLQKRGVLDEWHMRAASEIRLALDEDAIFHAGLTGGSNLDQLVRVDNSVKAPSFPAGYGRSGEVKARFAKWSMAMSERAIASEAVLDVVVKDKALREVEGDHELRNGSLSGIIREALELYASIAEIPRELGDEEAA